MNRYMNQGMMPTYTPQVGNPTMPQFETPTPQPIGQMQMPYGGMPQPTQPMAYPLTSQRHDVPTYGGGQFTGQGNGKGGGQGAQNNWQGRFQDVMSQSNQGGAGKGGTSTFGSSNSWS